MNHLILSSRYTLVKRLIVFAILIGGLSILPATAQENSVTIGGTQLKEDAVLWLVPSGNGGQQGLILPVATKAGFTPSEKGMVIYDPSDNKVYFWNGSNWQDMVGGGSVSINSLDDLSDVDATAAATGQVLKWNGSAWVPGTDESGGSGSGSDDQQLTFDAGTKILSIENGNTVDLSSLISAGGADDWGTQVVVADNSLSGEGTSADPLKLDQQGAGDGQILKWDETTGEWLPANDNVAVGGGAVNTNPRLEGDGTAGSPLDLADQGAASGQVLKWDGTDWTPADDETGTGVAAYTAGAGISIDGSNVISNTGDADADPANEIQSLSFNAGTNELSLSDGNTVTIPSGGTDADADPTNEIQDISLSGTNLSITDGSTIDLSPIVPPGGTDDQNLVLIGDVLTIEDGTGSIDLGVYGDDADSDPTNEIDVTNETGILLGDGAVISGLSGTADGQVAKWDAGAGSWVAGTDETGSGGSSLWTENGADIHYDAGRVGVGISTPEGQVEVSHNSTVLDPQMMLFEEETDYARLTFKNGTGNFWTIAGLNDATPAGERLNFYNGSTGDLMSLTGDGKLGIGVGLSPRSTLDLKGGLWDVTSTEGDFRIGDDTYRLKVGVATGGGGAGDTRIRAVGGTNRIMIGGGANDVLTINDQFVGIGTITPSTELEVMGTIRSSDLTGTGERNVVADASGNLTIGSSGGSSLWTENVSDIYYNAGNVGIGTNTPEAALDVHGDFRVNSSAGTFFIGYPGDNNGWDFGTLFGGEDLQIWSKSSTDRVKRLHFSQSGNVGIGDAIPQTKFHISSDVQESMRVESTSAQNYITFFNSNGYRGYAGNWTGSDDMDFGTGAGNTVGKVHLTTNALPKLTVAANGDVGIGTTAPTAKLDVQGSVSLTGELNRPSTGTANMVPIAYGTIRDNGSIYTGSGNFTVVRTSTGKYHITISGETYRFFDYAAVVSLITGPGFIDHGSVSNTLAVDIYDTSGTPTDGIFTFVVYKP